MKVLIIPNYTRRKTKEALDEVIQILKAHEAYYVIDESEAAIYPEEIFDLIISLGGDGTFLRSSKIAYKMDVPILGINTGNAGCLTNVSISNIPKAINKLLNEDINDNCRQDILLNVSINNNETVVINEVALIRVSTPAIYTVMSDEEVIFQTFSTGLIFCTPLGSSGYNISAGGKRLEYESDTFAITAICPITKNAKSMVVDANKEFKIICNKEVYLSLDGNDEIKLAANEEILLKKAKRSLQTKKN